MNFIWNCGNAHRGWPKGDFVEWFNGRTWPRIGVFFFSGESADLIGAGGDGHDCLPLKRDHVGVELGEGEWR